jgi:MinD-like ATPase involved in chromosome partitioning or flagellar assembly
MIVTVGSIRGAPGATSWSLLLAAAWPREFTERRVVLEADSAGGVLGARYGFGVEPGAVRMVTTIRRNGTSNVSLDGVAREVDAGLFVVPGPESGEQARAVWNEGAATVAAHVASDRGLWFVDAGRLDDANPSMVFADHSALVVLVLGPRQEDLVQLPSRVATLRQRCSLVSVVVSGRCAFGADEVSEFARADAVWVVPTRDDLVDEVGRLLGGSRARRSWLWRHALDVAAGAFGLLASRPPVSSEVSA